MALTQISTAGVKDDAVTAGKIPANAVGSSELADNAVDTAAIADDAVTSAKIAANAITANELADSAVDTNAIQDSAVTEGKLATSSVSINKMANNSVGTAEIVDDAVTAAKLASNAVVNASVDASAAIAGTKISPDFGSQTISTTGGMQLNGASVDIGEKLKHIGDLDTFFSFPTNDTIGLTTGNTERMRIDSSGKVGIGKTDPSFILDLKGATTDTLRLNHSGESGSGSHDVKIVAGGSHYQNMHFEGSNIFFKTYNGSSVGERFRIRSTGGVTFNGDTAAANALDDYEEGTFTPAYDAGGGVTFSYPQQYGFYTKIGDKVTFELYLQAHASTITSGNGGNGVVITGLPFTALNHSRYYPAVTIGRTYFFQLNDNKRIYAYVQSGNSYIRLIQEQNDTAGTIFTAQQLDHNTCEILVSGHYRV